MSGSKSSASGRLMDFVIPRNSLQNFGCLDFASSGFGSQSTRRMEHPMLVDPFQFSCWFPFELKATRERVSTTHLQTEREVPPSGFS